MRIIGIDSTRNVLTIVLIDNDSIEIKSLNEGNKKHNSLLLPTIDDLLNNHNLSVKDLSAVGAVIGPGSFTGIRVGVATANAIAYALKLPLIEVTAFELLTYNKTDGVALIDALHGNYYGAIVKGGNISKMRFFENGETIDGVHFLQDDKLNYGTEFANILKNKALNNDYKQYLMPLYLRKSQAEREAEINE